jgi:hypothetical protein
MNEYQVIVTTVKIFSVFARNEEEAEQIAYREESDHLSDEMNAVVDGVLAENVKGHDDDYAYCQHCDSLMGEDGLCSNETCTQEYPEECEICGWTLIEGECVNTDCGDAG